MLKAKQAWCLLASLLVSFALCLDNQSICFTDFDDRHPSIGVNLRGPHTLTISYWPDLFLTDRYSQDNHSFLVTILRLFYKVKALCADKLIIYRDSKHGK